MPWLLKSFSNEPSHERLSPVKLDQTHYIHSSLVLQAYLSVYSQREEKKKDIPSQRGCHPGDGRVR